jgi:hypothetical protein
MKKLILLTVVITALCTAKVQSQTTTNQPIKGSEIQFKEMSFDFGTINEGTQATHLFEFTNTGDSDLILLDVQRTCGCTTPTWPHQPIKPGQKDIITVVYNSSGRPGEFHKDITVTTNMKHDNVLIIKIHGKVTPKEIETPQPVTPVK